MTLNERIAQLEQQVKDLTDTINTLVTPTKSTPPYTVGGRTPPVAWNRPVDIGSGLGMTFGSPVVWNSLELNTPAANQEIPIPIDIATVKGYNRHSHSRISGGALEANTLEIVDLDLEGHNPHSAQYWQSEPQPIKMENSKGESVSKIGKLSLVFNPDRLTWGVDAYAIDVQSCYFIKRRTEANKDGEGNPIEGEDAGDIEKDENDNAMISPLYVTKPNGEQDIDKSSIIWDKNAKAWRLFAVYAGEPETP